MAVAAAAAVVCRTPAGIHSARVGGSAHVVSPAEIDSTPVCAQASWWAGWTCSVKRCPLAIVKRPTSTAPNGGSSSTGH
jgi:hypothetical protein